MTAERWRDLVPTDDPWKAAPAEDVDDVFALRDLRTFNAPWREFHTDRQAQPRETQEGSQ